MSLFGAQSYNLLEGSGHNGQGRMCQGDYRELVGRLKAVKEGRRNEGARKREVVEESIRKDLEFSEKTNELPNYSW